MISWLRHIAVFVPDLQMAECYYQSVFDMELIGREAEMSDGLWYTLPLDKGWDEAEAAGIELGMVAIRKSEFVLALFRGDAPRGQVYAIGLTMPAEEIARVRSRLPQDAQVSEDAPGHLEFRDPYRIIWQIFEATDFRTSGDFTNRWIQFS
jgi:catechol 2,3-dioxygenase-like lactoylglutathione lyase family enzyme